MKCQHFVRNRAVEFIHFAESQNQTNRNFFTFDIQLYTTNRAIISKVETWNLSTEKLDLHIYVAMTKSEDLK